MAVRPTMSNLISQIRLQIADPEGTSQQFDNQQIQNKLDELRDDVRYERLQSAPSIVNTASTNNQAQFVYADFYSRFQWWESDVVLQGDLSGNFWKALTPVASDYITGHWQFQLTPFVNGTAPGQLPPVYITGKVYDLSAAAADLLRFWAATLAGAYDITVNGQSLHRSQMMKAKLEMANYFSRQAKPKIGSWSRSDVAPVHSGLTLLSDELVRGV
jgi:hypothetical protein